MLPPPTRSLGEHDGEVDVVRQQCLCGLTLEIVSLDLVLARGAAVAALFLLQWASRSLPPLEPDHSVETMAGVDAGLTPAGATRQ